MSGERHIKAAFAYLYIRDFTRAMESFKLAIEADPENPAYFFHASVTAHRNQLYDIALEWAERAAKLAPKNSLYAEHLDVVKSTLLTVEAMQAKVDGKFDEALELLTCALKRDPLNDDAAEELVVLQQLALTDHHHLE